MTGHSLVQQVIGGMLRFFALTVNEISRSSRLWRVSCPHSWNCYISAGLNAWLGGRFMQPKRPALESLSNEALCKLRDEIAALLESRAEQLRKELERLTGGTSVTARITNNTGNGAKAKRKKPSPKYRGPDGSTWSGRGARPRWLTKAIQAGQKIEDFLIVPSDEAVSEERTSGPP